MTVGFELGADRSIGVNDLRLRPIDKMQDHAGTFGMAEEARTEAGAFMGAFDEPRQIGNQEITARSAHHAELRIERGEGIIGDLGSCRGDARKKSGFARIGKADQPNVGDQFQPQPDGFFFPRLAGIGMARCLIGRALEMGVAKTAISAPQDADACARLGEIGDQALVVFLIDLRAHRHSHDCIRAVGARHVLAHAGTAAFRRDVLLEAVVDEGVQVLHRLHPDIAPIAAIAAIGTAVLDEFLAAERNAAIPAFAGADIDLRLVEELHDVAFRSWWSARLSTTLWQNTLVPRERQERSSLPSGTQPSFASTLPEAGLS